MSVTLTKDQYRNHFNRWLEIFELLPIGYVSLVEKELELGAGKATAKRIKEVAAGRAYDFEILDALEVVVEKAQIRFMSRQKIRVY